MDDNIMVQVKRGDNTAFRISLRSLFSLLAVNGTFMVYRDYRIVVCQGDKEPFIEDVCEEDDI